MAQEGVSLLNAVEGEGVKVVVEHAMVKRERCRAVKIEVEH